MDASRPLTLIGTGFLVLALLLLAVPVILVARKLRPWRGVVGLWVAGWGFLLVGVGIGYVGRGWGGLVVPGVALATVGHFMQWRLVRR